jgi:signal peptidase I
MPEHSPEPFRSDILWPKFSTIAAALVRSTTMKSQPPAPARPADARTFSDSDGSPSKPTEPKVNSRREMIESFVVMLVAFLVWSIEAEGFVIPTGSMAPTLLGRHKEVTCPECRHVYLVNADSEVDSNGSGASTGIRVTWGTCENCRFPTRIDDVPSLSGDRIYTMNRGLALPFVPQAGSVGPRRWEVTVFRLPEEPEVRYIKRMVGLPNETLRIHQGDLWRKSHDGGWFERLLRPLSHQNAMRQIVYDDANRAKSLQNDPRWRRWVSPDQGWRETSEGTYQIDQTTESGSASGNAGELRYRHVVPEPQQWREIAAGEPLSSPPRPSLITDFSSYNTDLSDQAQHRPRAAARPWFQPNWVGDLILSCKIKPAAATGRFEIELIKGGFSNRCVIDLATGLAELYHDEDRLGEPTKTKASEPGEHSITFANVDDRLTLIVDGQTPFGDGLSHSANEPIPGAVPTPEDLEPVRIKGVGANLELSGLLLQRDIHYTIAPGLADIAQLDDLRFANAHMLFEILSDPARLAGLGQPAPRDFDLGEGRYMMLGDNSPWSRDSRAWDRKDQIDEDFPGRGWDTSGRESWEVPEALIIGKAFCVYLPHLQPVWPAWKLTDDFRWPAIPRLDQLRWIR